MPRDNLGERTSAVGLSSLISLANQASRKVPAVKYAFGLAGIAACGAIISLVLGTTKSALIILTLTFIGSVLLFVFARLSMSENQSVFAAGLALIWAIVAFFTFFLVITTTAFVGAWPQPWADFLGVSTGKAEQALCDQRVGVMWSQFFNPVMQYSDALKTAERISGCAPFQYFTLKGAIAFYSADYLNAVEAFEAAHKLDPTDDPITRNLGDSYVEVGRLSDALVTYNSMKNKNFLWSYKVARVKFYMGSFDEALTSSEKVPSDLAEDGGLLGRPRVLEAAIIIERAKRSFATVAPDLIIEARTRFKAGVELDKSAWDRLLKNTRRTKHETFFKQVDVLQPYLVEWLY